MIIIYFLPCLLASTKHHTIVIYFMLFFFAVYYISDYWIFHSFFPFIYFFASSLLLFRNLTLFSFYFLFPPFIPSWHTVIWSCVDGNKKKIYLWNLSVVFFFLIFLLVTQTCSKHFCCCCSSLYLENTRKKLKFHFLFLKPRTYKSIKNIEKNWSNIEICIVSHRAMKTLFI